MATDDATPPETWKPVVGYEGLYMVSDLGNVRSLRRSSRPRLRGDLLSPGMSAKSGRFKVALCRDSKQKTVYVHRLVLEAFVGPCPEGCEALHGPRGPLVNSLDNLSWGTRSQNQGPDMLRDGTSRRGKPRKLKFTEAMVLECRRRYAAGEAQLALAAEFSVSPSAMSQAIIGVHFARLPGAVPGDEDRHKARGDRHYGARLTAEIVLECRARSASGENSYALAREFGVAQPTMHAAISGRTWKRLPGAVPADAERHSARWTPRHSLTPELVEQARERCARGESQRVVAASFGVAQSTLQNAMRRHAR
jgi:NUMOD4 motif-containing protein/HNH endonuclease